MLEVDSFFWENPPWGDGKKKYRLGLKPISKDEWIDRKIGPNLYEHKRKLLDCKYNNVIAVTSDSFEAQEILGQKFNLKKLVYPDAIADMSLLIQDDLCLIRANGNQELLAASVCSPSYWNLKSKIGKPLKDIHQPVTTLNEKIGERIHTFINQAPIMKPFGRQNWLIHGDTKRFHLSEEVSLPKEPSKWFIRSERETLCRFHEDYSLFTINVIFQPLSLIHNYPEQKQNLLASIKTFDAEEIDYFGGYEKVSLLEKYLLS